MKGEIFHADVLPDFLEAFNAVFRNSISGETLRMAPLFITYALQESRAFPNRVSPTRPQQIIQQQAAQNGSRPQSGQGLTRERSNSRPSPFNPPITPSREVSRAEVGIQILDVLADVLCEPGPDGIELVNRFARTVTNKVSISSLRASCLERYHKFLYHQWLLHLLAERSDPRILVLS